MAVQLFQVGNIQNIPNVLESIGIYQFILPFLLALAIFYGVLRFSFGDKLEKSVVGLISLILSFFVMLFTSWNSWIVQFFTNLGGSALMIATGILVIIIFLGLFGIKTEDIFPKGNAKWIFILFIVFIAVMIFLGAGAGGMIAWPYLGSDFQAAIIIIIIVALAMWWMTSGDKKAGGGEEKKGGE
jgi:hypothetical protein